QIGEGSPNKAGTPAAHGAALGPEEIKLTKEALNWPQEPAFHIPDAVKTAFGEVAERGRQREEEWQARFDAYAAAHPALADEWRRSQGKTLPEGWQAA